MVKSLRRGSFAQRAARMVPISDVLTWLGVANPGTPPDGVSVKVFCPFSETHPPDRAGEKDMRMYGDGKAYCHICAQQYDSVSLAQQAWALSRMEAARAVLAHAGLDVGDDENLSLLRQVSPEARRSGAIAALGTWADHRGVDRFGAPYARCLSLADHIQQEEHVEQWLSACKTFLEQSDA